MTTEGRRRFPLALDRFQPAAPGSHPSAPGSASTPANAAARSRASAAVASRLHVPQGHGMDSADVRRRMVERLRALGIADANVLRAFGRVARHRFVDAGLATQAYEDTSLPIGLGQTISKPSVVARMLELLGEGANARARAARGADPLGATLEIGTGCGYQAALLCELASSVVSVERLRALHDKAREHLAEGRSSKLQLVFGDGMRGHPPRAPYDSIVAAAGGDQLPQAWLDQLAVGGRLVSPVEQANGAQVLVVVDRDASGWKQGVHEGVRFVPLKSGLAG